MFAARFIVKINRWLLRKFLGQFSQICVIEGNPISRRVAEKLMDILKNGFHHWKEHKEYY